MSEKSTSNLPLAGWSYCRRIGDKTPGWLPADRIAELAQLIAGLGFQDMTRQLTLVSVYK